MKPVGDYLCIREEALDDAAEGRAQAHAHHLDLLPAPEPALIRLQRRKALSLKDFIDAMIAQVRQGHGELVPAGPLRRMLCSSIPNTTGQG